MQDSAPDVQLGDCDIEAQVVQLLCGRSESADISCDQMRLGPNAVDRNATRFELVDNVDEPCELRSSIV